MKPPNKKELAQLLTVIADSYADDYASVSRDLNKAIYCLHFLEKDKHKNNTSKRLKEVPKANYQMSLFEADPRYKEVQALIEALDINTISPVEALLKLNEIKTILTKVSQPS